MALVNCPECGAEISSKAKKCPKCGYKKRNKKMRVLITAIILVVVLVSLGLGGYYGVQYINEKKEIERKETIDRILNEIKDDYKSGNLNAVSELCDQLDDLDYDTSEIREILEYDLSVYEAVNGYYNSLKKFADSVSGGGSINSAISTFKTATDKFDLLPIDTASEYGRYIQTIRNNPMYISLKADILEDTKTDYDYYLTRDVYVYIIDSYTDELLSHSLPY